MKKTYLYLLGGVLLLWAACARVGSPTGGAQDKTSEGSENHPP